MNKNEKAYLSNKVIIDKSVTSMERAITEAGLSIEFNYDGTVKIVPQVIQLKQIEWFNYRECIATLPDGNQASVIFTSMENQVVIHHD